MVQSAAALRGEDIGVGRIALIYMYIMIYRERCAKTPSHAQTYIPLIHPHPIPSQLSFFDLLSYFERSVYLMILVTSPVATVRPPSLMLNR